MTRPPASPATSRKGLRPGFTLLELLIVIAIIALLVSLTVPAIFKARATAASVQDKSQLKNIGIGLQVFATNDPAHRFCTGAYDFRRDGCPDTWGWVADLVNSGSASGADLISPISDMQGSEKLNDLLGGDTTDSKDGAPQARLAAGICGGANKADAADDFNSTVELSPERAIVVSKMIEDGYTTNYAASWWLVRSGPKLQPNSNPLQITLTGGLKGLSGSLGPLTRTRLETSKLPANTVSFIGVGAPGDVDEAVLLRDIPGHDGVLTQGVQLAEAFNDGPAISDGTQLDLLDNKKGVTLASVLAPIKTAGGLPNGDTIFGQTGMYLQDTRDWYAWGGSGKQKHCNLLQADGSVVQVTDLNGDGFLNPGFAITDAGTALQTVGYTDGTVELPPSVSFSGPLLDEKASGKQKFE